MRKRIVFILVFFIITMQLTAHDSSDPLHHTTQLPQKYLGKVSISSGKTEQAIDKKIQKPLAQLQQLPPTYNDGKCFKRP
jgi:hypothetical protein